MNGPRWVDLEVEGHKAECIKALDGGPKGRDEWKLGKKNLRA